MKDSKWTQAVLLVTLLLSSVAAGSDSRNPAPNGAPKPAAPPAAKTSPDEAERPAVPEASHGLEVVEMKPKSPFRLSIAPVAYDAKWSAYGEYLRRFLARF